MQVKFKHLSEKFDAGICFEQVGVWHLLSPDLLSYQSLLGLGECMIVQYYCQSGQPS